MNKRNNSNASFWFGKTNLSEFRQHPYFIEGGFVISCTQGEGIISSGIQKYPIVKNSTALFLSGMTFYLESASEDFFVSMFSFSKKLHNEIVLKLPPDFTLFMNETPVYEHPEKSESLAGVYVMMEMAELVFRESSNAFVHILQKNFVESYVNFIMGYIQPFLQTLSIKGSRSQQLFHRFISLVHTFCRQHHDAKFYADQLCITPRYLYQITMECSQGLSPKQLIDKQLTLEIKAIINSTDKTITEIAQILNLPDQSYLCRYFKRQTGLLPTQYRAYK